MEHLGTPKTQNTITPPTSRHNQRYNTNPQITTNTGIPQHHNTAQIFDSSALSATPARRSAMEQWHVPRLLRHVSRLLREVAAAQRRPNKHTFPLMLSKCNTIDTNPNSIADPTVLAT